MKNFLICIISSEKTWRRIQTLGLQKNLEAFRPEFDLAFVLNGNDAAATEFIDSFSPEFFFVRENSGMDPAAIEFLLKKIPAYEWTVILHDDHRFGSENWFDKIKEIAENPEADVYGNVLPITLPADFWDYVENRGFAEMMQSSEISVLQGMAGLFSKRAINILKNVEFNFELTNDKRIAEFGEWIFSLAIHHNNLEMKLFDNEVFGFLQHSDDNEKAYFYWNGFLSFLRKEWEKSERFLKNYLDYFYNDNDNMIWFVYSMLTTATLSLGKYNETVYFAQEARAHGMLNPQIDAMEKKAREMLNV